MTTKILTPSDSGTTIAARPGDEILLRLPENPTTGYRWQVDRASEHLVSIADAYQPDVPARIGSGGVREFQIRAEASGTVHLELTHRQAWEGEASVTERFTVTIEIGE